MPEFFDPVMTEGERLVWAGTYAAHLLDPQADPYIAAWDACTAVLRLRDLAAGRTEETAPTEWLTAAMANDMAGVAPPAKPEGAADE